MTKWEYKFHTYCPYAGKCLTVMPVDRRPLRFILAALGAEGWELVRIEKAGQCPGGGSHEELLFKRPVLDVLILSVDPLMALSAHRIPERPCHDPS